MAESKITISPRTDPLSLSADGGILLNPLTSISDRGIGGYVRARAQYCYYDKCYFTGLEYQHFITNPLFTSGDPNKTHLLLVPLGSSTRRFLVTEDEDGDRHLRWRSIGDAKIGWGRQELGGGSQELGGEDLGLGGKTWDGMYFGSSMGIGAELWLGRRAILSVDTGLLFGTFFPFASDEERELWSGSSNFVSFFMAIGLTWGDDNYTKAVDRRLNTFDIVDHFATKGVGYVQRGLSPKWYNDPVSGAQAFLKKNGQGGGGDVQQTEDIRFFQSVVYLLKPIQIASSIDFNYHAFASGRTGVAWTDMGADGLSGIIFLATQYDIPGGIADLHMVGSKLLYDYCPNLDRRSIVAIRFFSGAIGQIISQYAGSSLAAQGNGAAAVSATVAPDSTDAGITETTSGSFSPISFSTYKASHGRGSVFIKHHLKGGWMTYFRYATHALSFFNIGNRMKEVAVDTGTEYVDVGHSSVTGGMGYEFKLDITKKIILGAGIGVHTSQNFGDENTVSFGVMANVNVDFMISKSWAIYLDFTAFAEEEITDKGFLDSLGVEGFPSAGFTYHF